MNSGYWTGVHDSDRPLKFSALFLIKWLGTKEVGHRGIVKVYHVNLKQHKIVLDFRTLHLLDLHKLCNEVECKPPALYSRHVADNIMSLGGILQKSSSPWPCSQPAHIIPLHTHCAAPLRHLPPLIRISLPYLFRNNDAIN